MKPAPFQYLAPRSIEETVELLREHGEDAKVLAGGQSLVPMLNFRLARPAVLIDVNSVTGLDGIEVEDGTLSVGATTRQRTLERRLSAGGSGAQDGGWALLGEAAGHIGHLHIRTRGTVGGSLAHADPAAELPAAVSALGATLVARSRDGEREIAPHEFFQGFFTTALRPDELLTRVRVPSWPEGTRSCLLEVSRRRGDFAQVAVAAVVAMADGRVVRAGVALAGVGASTVEAPDVAAGLVGEVPRPQLIAELADDLCARLDPPSDTHGSAGYRRALAGHLLQRALLDATSPTGAAAAA
ncbi:xanthine dehydrogenase family protein subunit M [Geodermatophilus sp. TF02-6]|uniref:FAD binding domain-containing protein n=1 Tax=Geodermatophilus sp. TF02-6 TaxID=2250575 RepID=UPI000DEBB78F|nr:FAD binding domain-containing protein [Geodermatophilus sp. TF02-6]RBY79569.1 xanthine dehydrogenase family protein subunit M [Geodermatophilus sp. TF02-6]